MTREDGPTALHPPVYPLATTAFTPATLTWFFVASDVFITDSTLARHDYAIARHDRACWQRIVIAESQEAESRLYSRNGHLGPRVELTAKVTTWAAFAMRRDRKALLDES